ncbi:MAG: glycosyltransferase [Candidatus Altiarchaeota archaeon]
MEPRISLIVCSKNRSGKLSGFLDSINPEDMNEVRGELVLVDNNSADDTLSVMNSFKEKASFPVKVVSEEKAGLGAARNTGLKAAGGGILAFTDDDCRLADDYLKKVVKVFESGEFQYCGGSVLVPDPSDAKYSLKEGTSFLIIPPRTFIGPGAIIGANMVFLREVVDTVGLFDPLFGAGSMFRGEDIEYIARVGMAGFTGAFIPELVVYHYHGRRQGSDELAKIISDNDFGRGACYMKMIASGYFRYLLAWVYFILLSFRPRVFWNELRGALAYLKLRIFG